MHRRRRRHVLRDAGAPGRNCASAAGSRRRTGAPNSSLATLLDLVALGTVADVVRLDRNNRILVSQGLKRMREGQATPGIAALFRAAGREATKATTFDLGFMLGPRLNAAGRLADMSLGIECLATDDPARALNIAQQLDALNKSGARSRRGCRSRRWLRWNIDVADTAGIALFESDWHQGVVGIVASRIKEKLHRPVFAFARADEDHRRRRPAAGSGRSIPGCTCAMRSTSSQTGAGLAQEIRWPYASGAGVTIGRPTSRASGPFAAVADELLAEDDLTRSCTPTARSNPAIFAGNGAPAENEIWGQGFPAPLFEGRFHRRATARAQEKHLKLHLKAGGLRFEAIQFNFAETPGTSAGGVSVERE